MMTEDEAKKKWCPFVRYQWGYDSTPNRWKQSEPPEEPHALNPAPCRCIASDCMAWRWDERFNLTPDGRGGLVVCATTLEGNKLGYCGLAGKP